MSSITTCVSFATFLSHFNLHGICCSHTCTCGLITCVSHINTISPPRVATQLPKPNKDLSAAKRARAKRCRGPTDDQLFVQSLVDVSSPTVIVMLVALIVMTHLLGRDGNLTQQRCGSEHESHSQRSRSANPKKCRSITPKPPRSVGRQTTG